MILFVRNITTYLNIEDDICTSTYTGTTKKAEDIPDTMIHFPMSLGLTGYACKEKTTIWTNNIDFEQRFNKDLDNLNGVGNIRNFLSAGIYLNYELSRKKVGVLQLINKTEKKDITDIDVEAVKAMLPFLGACVNNISVINNMVKIIFDVSLNTSPLEVKMTNRDELNVDLKIHYEGINRILIALRRILDTSKRQHKRFNLTWKKLISLNTIESIQE